MNLKIASPDIFVDEFIQPVSRITECGILKLEPSKISSLVSTGDGTIIVYGEYQQELPEVTETVSLNIPDVKKFHKLLNLINGPIDLTVDRNSISYASDSVKFKYHLYEDGIIKLPSLNMSILKTIEFDTTFSITAGQISNLIKGSTLNPDIAKMYITFANGKVYGDITDKARHNVDSYSTIISDKVNGTQLNTSIPINFEIIRLLNSSKIPTFNVKLSTKLNVFNFELISPNVSLNYIVSALIN